MISFDPEILKANDMRGTYPGQLDEEFARLLGWALPRVLSARKVAVGYDARVSSPALYASLVAGLRKSGAVVGTLGMCPTELLYFVLGSSEEYDLGVMVTASHNPPEFNGFKLCGPHAEPVTRQNGLQDVINMIRSQKAPPPEPAPEPERGVSAEEDYLKFALEYAGNPDCHDTKVVVDPGNGVGGLLWEYLQRETGFHPIRMNFEPDGRFPAHLPDITKEANMVPLRQKVLESGADLGLAYDGDADRVRAVLANGNVIDGSETGAALGLRIMRDHPGMNIAVGMTASRAVLDYLNENGCAPLLVPVGHAKIKRVMRSTSSLIFAAESSGHFYYRDFYFCDSALISTLLLLQMAAADELQPVARTIGSEWYSPPKSPVFRFEVWKEALRACRHVAQRALDQFAAPDEIICERNWQVDRKCAPTDIEQAEGVRVDYPDWYFCVRPSGTEPLARLTVQAKTPEQAAQMQQSLSGYFKETG